MRMLSLNEFRRREGFEEGLCCGVSYRGIWVICFIRFISIRNICGF